MAAVSTRDGVPRFRLPVPPPRRRGRGPRVSAGSRFRVLTARRRRAEKNFEFGFQVPGSGLAVRPGPRFRGSEVPGSTLGRRFQVPGKRGWGDAEHGACHALRRARTRTTLAHFCFEKTFLCDNLWGCGGCARGGDGTRATAEEADAAPRPQGACSQIFFVYAVYHPQVPAPTTPGSEVPGSAARPVRWQRFRRFQVPGSGPPESVGGG